LAEVEAWPEQRAAPQATQEDDAAKSADIERLAGALADATRAAREGGEIKIAG
jgi:hypothetical protein